MWDLLFGSSRRSVGGSGLRAETGEGAGLRAEDSQDTSSHNVGTDPNILVFTYKEPTMLYNVET